MSNSFVQNENNFWSSGETYISYLINKLYHLCRTFDFKTATCLELGCGVGRLTLPLVNNVAKVIAVDISKQHLELCKRQISDKAGQTEFVHLQNLGDLDMNRELDLFVSYISLQHSPPPIQFEILKKILKQLKPGGLAVFQLAVEGYDYTFKTHSHLERSLVQGNIDMHVLPLTAVFKIQEFLGFEIQDIEFDGSSGGSYLSALIVMKRK